MSKLCGLSRSRFYELTAAGVMPQPVYDPQTRRPMYTSEMQLACLRVRSSNIGIDGRYVLFYQSRASADQASPSRSRPRSSPNRTILPPCAELTETLRSLGLAGV